MRVPPAGVLLLLVPCLSLADQLPVPEQPQAVITVTKCLAPAVNTTASVPNVGGHTYTWTVTNGTLTSGQGTSLIHFTTGAAGVIVTLKVVDSGGGPPVTSTTTVQVNFTDYPPTNQTTYFDCFYTDVCAIGRNSITVGCGGGNYCPTAPITREQMAVFLLKGEHTAAYTPPACTGIFSDVPCPSQYANWIEQLYNEQITSGCGANPLLYCPSSPVTRAQMAVFLTKIFRSPSYQPPPATGCAYCDVPVTAFGAAFIEQLKTDGHVASGYCEPDCSPHDNTGCSHDCTQAGSGAYFPNNSVTREQMARFVALTFGIN